jgi:hypothetical protein
MLNETEANKDPLLKYADFVRIRQDGFCTYSSYRDYITRFKNDSVDFLESEGN